MPRSVSLIEIDVDQLEPDPENVRGSYDPEVVRGLATFFKDQGSFIENPVVWRVGKLADGRPLYRAFSGSTRAQAARGVGGRITVQVLPQPPAGSAKLLGQLAAGLVKGDLNPIDVSRTLKRLQAEGRRSVQDLVRELADWGISRSRTWVFQHLHLADLAPEVQALVARGELPLAAVQALYTRPAGEQLRLARALAEGRLQLAHGELRAPPPEAIQAEIGDKLAQAVEAAERRSSRQPAPSEKRHGPVQARRLLLGVDEPEAFSRLPQRRKSAEDWAAQASDEERALAREAFHLGGLPPEEAISAVDRWQREAETAPDELLMAAHGLKRLMDSWARNPDLLARYPGLMALLRLRAGALTHMAELVEARDQSRSAVS